MSIAEINLNIHQNQNRTVSLKRSLSYNDLKRKRMLRSEKSKSKLKTKQSNEINKQPQNEEINKSTQRFIKQLKGLITDYEGATLKNSHTLKNQISESNNKSMKSAQSHRNLGSSWKRKEQFEISNIFNLSLKPSGNLSKGQKEEAKQRHKILERINKSVRVDCKKDQCRSQKIRELNQKNQKNQKEQKEKEKINERDESIFGLDMSKIKKSQNDSIGEAKIQIENLLSVMSRKVSEKRQSNQERLRLSKNSSQKNLSRLIIQESTRQKLPKDFFK